MASGTRGREGCGHRRVGDRAAWGMGGALSPAGPSTAPRRVGFDGACHVALRAVATWVVLARPPAGSGHRGCRGCAGQQPPGQKEPESSRLRVPAACRFLMEHSQSEVPGFPVRWPCVALCPGPPAFPGACPVRGPRRQAWEVQAPAAPESVQPRPVRRDLHDRVQARGASRVPAPGHVLTHSVSAGATLRRTAAGQPVPGEHRQEHRRRHHRGGLHGHRSG